MARKRKSRELQLGRYLEDRNLSVFSNDDKVTLMAHANSLGCDAVDYLQQCEEHIKILMEGDVSDMDMMNTIEKMLQELPAPQPVVPWTAALRPWRGSVPSSSPWWRTSSPSVSTRSRTWWPFKIRCRHCT